MDYDEPSTLNALKRFWSEETLDNAGTETPGKRHKREGTVNAGDRPQEVIVLGEDDEPSTLRRGTGTVDDPITLTEIMTGNVISVLDDEPILLLSDDDEGAAEESVTRDSSPLLRLSTPKLSTPSRTPTPGPEASAHDFSDFQIASGHDLDQMLSDDKAEDEDEEDNNCYIVIDSAEDEEDYDITRVSSQIPLWPDWFMNDIVKKEPEDEVPELALTQDTQDTEDLVTPDASQDTISFPERFLPQDNINPLPSTTDESPTHRKLADFPTDPTGFKAWFEEEERKDNEKKAYTKLKKRLFWDIYVDKMRPTLRKKLEKFMHHVSDTSLDDGCWLYEGPRSAGNTNSISMTVYFCHESERHELKINLGFIAMLLAGLLTDEAKEGIIEERWHASHLCGNWRCINARHFNPESGSINSKRNGCFHRKVPTCVHVPPCLKHLTILADQRKKGTGDLVSEI